MKRALLHGSLICFFAGLSLAAPASIPHGTVELISRDAAIQPGQPFLTGLDFRLEPGWHVYWQNPGDSGQPPRVSWNVPEGVTPGSIQWPVPKRLPVGPLLDYGYEDHVLLPVPFQTSAALKGDVPLKGHLRVLVCRETCIPGKAELALTLPVSNGARRRPNVQTTALFRDAENSMPKSLPASWRVSAHAGTDDLILLVSGLPASPRAAFFPAAPNVINNAAPQKSSPAPAGLELTLKRADPAQPVGELKGLLVLQGASSAAYDIALPVSSSPPAAGSSKNAAPLPQSSTSSLAGVLLFAFLGGLILNLMPCVFPVLSIKVLSVLHSGDAQSRPKANAFTYTAGILLSFWLLVAVLLILRSAGGRLGWGFQLQSPGFVAFLICFLFVFGLNLAGVFEIGGSLMGVGSGLASRQGISGSFFSGVLATVVATPCTAPFMGSAIAFALSQPALICFSVFTAMALGLSFPFLLIAYLPALSRALPRPGAWMETVKHFLAFPVFATVIWLLWVLGRQANADGLVRMLIALLGISMAVWIYGRWPANRIATVVGVLLLAASFIYAVREGQAARTEASALAASTSSGRSVDWEPFTPEKLASYRLEGRPVLIDFTAAWCLTCQVNERVAFGAQDVRKRLRQDKIALLRADWTSYDPGITETLAKFGRSGVPLYVLYGPGSDTNPVLLPDGVFGPSTVLRALDNLKL